MAISVPEETVYYYECSAGRFRLVYFIPVRQLKRLADDGRIEQKALVDFPDGLDLDCTEADFSEFEKAYRYRPPHDAEKLRQAFLAIFSNTNDWKKFRGSGFLAASDLEGKLEPVETMIRETAMGEEPEAADRSLAAPAERRQLTRRRAVQRQALQWALEQLEVDGVDPGKSMKEQSFSPIKMSKGEPAPEFFAKLQRQRR